MNWSKILKTLRENMMLTQTDMAKLLKVSFASINRWENGHNVPAMKIKRKLKDLCVEHNIDINKFVEVKEEN